MVGEEYLLSFQEAEGDVFSTVRARIEQGRGRVRERNAVYLAFALLDAVVDGYAQVHAELDLEAVAREDELDDGAELDPRFPSKIHGLKRRLADLKRAVSPLTEEIGRLLRDDHALFDSRVRPYFRDLHDHLLQVNEGIESTREATRAALELHLSQVSFKMNQDMRVLTVVATIFIPLTFLAGVYGMNFKMMPELEWRFGYLAFWAFTVVLVGTLLVLLRRKRWL